MHRQTYWLRPAIHHSFLFSYQIVCIQYVHVRRSYRVFFLHVNRMQHISILGKTIIVLCFVARFHFGNGCVRVCACVWVRNSYAGRWLGVYVLMLHRNCMAHFWTSKTTTTAAAAAFIFFSFVHFRQIRPFLLPNRFGIETALSPFRVQVTDTVLDACM